MNEPDYEQLIGKWVTARCHKRVAAHGKSMPKPIRDWLDTLAWNPGAGDAQAPAEALGWLVKTIDDPAWGETD